MWLRVEPDSAFPNAQMQYYLLQPPTHPPRTRRRPLTTPTTTHQATSNKLHPIANQAAQVSAQTISRNPKQTVELIEKHFINSTQFERYNARLYKQTPRCPTFHSSHTLKCAEATQAAQPRTQHDGEMSSGRTASFRSIPNSGIARPAATAVYSNPWPAPSRPHRWTPQTSGQRISKSTGNIQVRKTSNY